MFPTDEIAQEAQRLIAGGCDRKTVAQNVVEDCDNDPTQIFGVYRRLAIKDWIEHRDVDLNVFLAVGRAHRMSLN
jgi:hypothetical protein